MMLSADTQCLGRDVDPAALLDVRGDLLEIGLRLEERRRALCRDPQRPCAGCRPPTFDLDPRRLEKIRKLGIVGKPRAVVSDCSFSDLVPFRSFPIAESSGVQQDARGALTIEPAHVQKVMDRPARGCACSVPWRQRVDLT